MDSSKVGLGPREGGARALQRAQDGLGNPRGIREHCALHARGGHLAHIELNTIVSNYDLAVRCGPRRHLAAVSRETVR